MDRNWIAKTLVIVGWLAFGIGSCLENPCVSLVFLALSRALPSGLFSRSLNMARGVIRVGA